MGNATLDFYTRREVIADRMMVARISPFDNVSKYHLDFPNFMVT